MKRIFSKLTLLTAFMMLFSIGCDDNMDTAIDKENRIAQITEDDTFKQNPALLPGNNGIIMVQNIVGTTISLAWENATITNSSNQDLKYQIFYSLKPDIVDSNSIQNLGTAATGWMINTLQYSISGLLENTFYYFNILVIDSNNNIAHYSIAAARTLKLDTALLEYPTPGNNGIVIVDMIKQMELNISWQAATDTKTISSDLLYNICYTKTSDAAVINFTISSDILKNIPNSSGWQKDLIKYSIKKLDKNTSYTIALLVADTDGNITIYNITTVATI